MIGADVSTVPFSVIQQMMKHPLTDTGLAKFIADWEKSKGAVGAGAEKGAAGDSRNGAAKPSGSRAPRAAGKR
jgi:hypothetical protein